MKDDDLRWLGDIVEFREQLKRLPRQPSLGEAVERIRWEWEEKLKQYDADKQMTRH